MWPPSPPTQLSPTDLRMKTAAPLQGGKTCLFFTCCPSPKHLRKPLSHPLMSSGFCQEEYDLTRSSVNNVSLKCYVCRQGDVK